MCTLMGEPLQTHCDRCTWVFGSKRLTLMPLPSFSPRVATGELSLATVKGGSLVGGGWDSSVEVGSFGALGGSLLVGIESGFRRPSSAAWVESSGEPTGKSPEVALLPSFSLTTSSGLSFQLSCLVALTTAGLMSARACEGSCSPLVLASWDTAAKGMGSSPSWSPCWKRGVGFMDGPASTSSHEPAVCICITHEDKTT